jgi:hypothetical protein
MFKVLGILTKGMVLGEGATGAWFVSTRPLGPRVRSGERYLCNV